MDQNIRVGVEGDISESLLTQDMLNLKGEQEWKPIMGWYRVAEHNPSPTHTPTLVGGEENSYERYARSLLHLIFPRVPQTN